MSIHMRQPQIEYYCGSGSQSGFLNIQHALTSILLYSSWQCFMWTLLVYSHRILPVANHGWWWNEELWWWRLLLSMVTSLMYSRMNAHISYLPKCFSILHYIIAVIEQPSWLELPFHIPDCCWCCPNTMLIGRSEISTNLLKRKACAISEKCFGHWLIAQLKGQSHASCSIHIISH